MGAQLSRVESSPLGSAMSTQRTMSSLDLEESKESVGTARNITPLHVPMKCPLQSQLNQHNLSIQTMEIDQFSPAQPFPTLTPIDLQSPTIGISSINCTETSSLSKQSADVPPLLLKRGSLASRRETLALSQPLSRNSLQPPKLNVLNISSTNTMSLPTATAIQGAHIKFTLDPTVLPVWLRNHSALSPHELPALFNEAFSYIEKQQNYRIERPQHTFCTTLISHDSHNTRKNRYQDIVPFDRNRVVLKVKSVDGMDYINASYIQGLFGIRDYIATQGPLPHTVQDFWQMTWEQNVKIILMLTSEEEKGRRKCHMYWPKGVQDTLHYPDIKLTVEFQREQCILNKDTIHRTFKLTKDGIEKFVDHIQYTGWPDHHVCNSTLVIKLVEYVQTLIAQSNASIISKFEDIIIESKVEKSPMIVHCSAGCGRTGSFCTIDSVISLLMEGKGGTIQDIIFECVLSMREQRLSMVQTLEQFVFCYETVLEWIAYWITLGNSAPWNHEMRDLNKVV